MFCRSNDQGYRNPTEGIRVKTLVYGENTLMTEFRLEKGAVLPRHQHPHEQTGYLVSGRLRLFIGGEQREVEPGDGWCISGDVEHGADVLEDSLAVEIFSPVREDYVPGEDSAG